MQLLPQGLIDAIPSAVSLSRKEALDCLNAFEAVANFLLPDRVFRLHVPDTDIPWWPKPGSNSPNPDQAINYLSRPGATGSRAYLPYIKDTLVAYNKALKAKPPLEDEAEEILALIPIWEANLWETLNTVAWGSLYGKGVYHPLEVSKPSAKLQVPEEEVVEEAVDEPPQPNTSASMTTENRVIVPEPEEEESLGGGDSEPSSEEEPTDDHVGDS